MDYEEEYIVYGTPLPPLEENENASKKPEIDLTVRDSKGRRRFHGAFTGGFSAGYFNTVGTEKGWIPSQYVSKKEHKWDKNLVKSKPEDFMDDEDFSLFGIAPKKVHTKDDFKGPEQEAFAGFRDPKASITDVLREIIKPSTQSIGVRLFTAMKKGRRYKGAFLKSKPGAKVYGCSIPPEFSKNNDENEFHDEPVVQPETFTLPYTPKNDFFGIGYKPLKAEIVNEDKSVPLTATLSGNKRLKITGEAFGYGALEEDDDYADDALIYSKEDLSNYDFEIGSVKKIESKPSTSAISSLTKGTLIGFVKAPRIEPPDSSKCKCKLPEIPKGWTPHPPFLKNKRASRWNQPPSTKDKSRSVPPVTSISSLIKAEATVKHETKSQMNANTRAIILGEEVDIVVGLKKNKEPNLTVSNPIKADLETKQIEKKQDSSSSKPLSVYFASKFVRSSNFSEEKFEPGLTESSKIAPVKTEKTVDDQQEVKSSVGLIKRETFQWHPHTLLSKRFNVPHPYPQFPDVVGVLKIGENTANQSKKTNQSKAKPQLFSALFDQPFEPVSSKSKTVNKNESKKVPIDSNIIEIEKIAEKVERPPLDLFKAIFASDESDSEQDEKGKDNDNKEQDPNLEKEVKQSKNDISKAENPKDNQSKSNESIPRSQVIQPKSESSKTGIFSGINLDLLSKSISYKLDSSVTNTENNEDKDDDIQVLAKDIQSNTYGPALPPPIDSEKKYMPSSSIRKRKEKKRKKSKSKSRHKTKKSKKKHKKRSSKSDSESSDSDDLEDSDHFESKKSKRMS